MASLMVLLAATLWGANGIFINLIGAQGFSGQQMTAIRLLTVPLVSGVLLLATARGALRVRRQDIIWFLLTGGVGVYAFNLLYTASIQQNGMATAAVLLYLMPSLVTLYSALFLGERFTLRKGLSLALSLAGCGLVCGIAQGFTVTPRGLAVGLGATVCYTAYNLLVAARLKTYNALTNVFYPFLVAAGCSMAALAVTGGLPALGALAVQRPGGAALCVALGVCCSVLPYTLYNTALGRIPASRVAVIATFEPVAAALFGALLFHETLDAPKLLGIGCELAALVLLALPAKDA